ncbi:TPA: baseplate protein [Enterobacter cloacae]
MDSMQGSWRAVVVGETDQKTFKVKVKVLGMMDGIPDDDLPWAEFLLPVGNGYIPAAAKDLVWVDFPYNGDSRRPRIIGGAMDWGGGQVNLAGQAGGKGTAGGTTSPGGSNPNLVNGVYQKPNVPGMPNLPSHTVGKDQIVTRNDVMEVRSHGGGYMIVNLKNNAMVGFNDAGDIMISTNGAVFINSGTNMTLQSGADLLIKAKGKINIEAGGDFTQKGATLTVDVSGAYQFSAGSATFKAGQFAFTK